MTTSTANFSTGHASKYLQQLCKHFGHKVPVEYTPDKGSITLPFGSCKLAATTERLTLRAVSETQDIARLEQVIGDHLARFAFRENPSLTWQRTD